MDRGPFVYLGGYVVHVPYWAGLDACYTNPQDGGQTVCGRPIPPGHPLCPEGYGGKVPCRRCCPDVAGRAGRRKPPPIDGLGRRALASMWRARQLRLERALDARRMHPAVGTQAYLGYAERWRDMAAMWVGLARQRPPRSAERLRNAAQAALTAANVAQSLAARGELQSRSIDRGRRASGAVGGTTAA